MVVEAMVLDSTAHIGSSVGLFRHIEALLPAGLIGLALAVAEVEGHDAPAILLAGFLFGSTVLLDALPCIGESCWNHKLVLTIVGLSALCNVNGFLIVLCAEAESPARGLGSALFIAIIKISWAFGVLLARSPLFSTFLFNAILRSSNLSSHFK